jgi:hypothetical protein
MMTRYRLAPAVLFWLAAAGGALAAEDSALGNPWALAVQRQLLRAGVWYTGIHRLDDGALFGLACCIVLTAFMVSAVGIMSFQTRGANFTVGWLVGVPVCVAALLAYAWVRPFPTEEDMAWMFAWAGGAQLAVLGAIRIFRSAAERDAAPKTHKPGKPAAVAKSPTLGAIGGRHATPVKAEDMRDRMKLAIRTGAGSAKR